jgi:acylphosphatase
MVKTLKVRAHVFIKGKVQGVFFRSEIKRRADSLSLKGWVRNLPDGSVEAVFEGQSESVNTIVEFCRTGPLRARVINFELLWENYIEEFKNFEIRY